MLHSGAVLVHHRRLVVVLRKSGNARHYDWQSSQSLACRNTHLWVAEEDVVQTGIRAEWNVCTAVVHVVALHTLVHGSESAANYRGPVPSQIVGKSDPGPEFGPMIVDHSMRNSR